MFYKVRKNSPFYNLNLIKAPLNSDHHFKGLIGVFITYTSEQRLTVSNNYNFGVPRVVVVNRS
jgi:hypothetical protein